MNRKYFLSIFVLGIFCIPINGKNRDKEVYTPFDRGIETPNSLFIPKGTISCGVTFSYNTYNIGNAANDAGFSVISSLLQGIKGKFNTMSTAPAFGYFFADNTSVGLRFEYGMTKFALDNADIQLSDAIKLNLSNCGFDTQTFLSSITFRNYMPIEHSKRFSLFMEGRLTGGYSQNKHYKIEEGLKHGVYQDIYKASISLVPGVCVFITNFMAFEVQIGVMGINFQKIVQSHNKVGRSEMFSSGANFNINLFSIGFGTTMYIMDKWHRVPKSLKKNRSYEIQ